MSIPLSIILEQLKRRYVLAAMEKIDHEGIAKDREPDEYFIKHPNRLGVNKPYPVKLVVEHAFNLASKNNGSGTKIASNDFSSSKKLRDYIEQKLGFNIEEMKV